MRSIHKTGAAQSNASPSTSTSPGYGSGLTGNLSDNYGGSLNQKLAGPIPPGSTTLQNALQQAYHNNPTLNAQRAATRVADENVPTALSGYRPRVTGTSSLSEQYLENLVKNQNSIDTVATANIRRRALGTSSEGASVRPFRPTIRRRARPPSRLLA